jgi:hypothetical protein
MKKVIRTSEYKMDDGDAEDSSDVGKPESRKSLRRKRSRKTKALTSTY